MIREAISDLVNLALAEDLGDGDHSSMACIPQDAMGKAKLIIKEHGIIAGLDIAAQVFNMIDEKIVLSSKIEDGSRVKPGDIGFTVAGSIHSLLKSERLVLNILQRMSGIATTTRRYVDAVREYKAKILDTRKTCPGFRIFEKEAVRLGGGMNHRMGLYDMIMLKDNHIDYSGGIKDAIARTNSYLERNNKSLEIEIEVRNLEELNEVLEQGMVNRIMLDNFSLDDTREAVRVVRGRFEIESSGGINLETVQSYAACGVDFISVGALTHQVKSMDISLKAYEIIQ